MCENINFNVSCITTAANYTFYEWLKSYISGDETVIWCADSLNKYVYCGNIGSNLVK